ncbi:hypothetical protein ID852_17320 [Xenorhabdus sp. 42]|uniref:hypothetical protein n=1 Tax=Xenorhabdus szentirmaii TaxID=290112 RepID=UPI0019B4B15B|nr:hypothetical protein [Xenorhabdus sp. 42]MBD2822410.1 hypothetical protein [Xenorhabdus sp. 42]
MAIDLLNIPDKADRKKPPEVKRWLSVLAAFIGIASFITLFLWPEETSKKSISFWLYSFIYPFFIWLLVFLVRRLYFDLNQFWSDNWDKERERLIEQEIARGQKTLYQLGSVIHIPDAVMQGTLSEQLVNSLISMRKITDENTGKVIRRKCFSTNLSQMEDKLYERICLLLADNTFSSVLVNAIKKTNVNVCLEFDAKLERSAYDKIWKKVCDNSQVILPMSYFYGQGMESVEQWIDSASRNETLLIVSVHLSKFDDDGHGDAAVALLVTASPAIGEHELNGNIICRPEDSSPNEMVYALSQALLWGKSRGEDIQYLWMSGMGCDNKAQILSAPLGETFPNLTESENQIDIDGKIGYTGSASPWLAISIASESAQRHKKAQLVMSTVFQESTKPWFMVVK